VFNRRCVMSRDRCDRAQRLASKVATADSRSQWQPESLRIVVAA
jgi:hypothetical protein